MDIITTTEYFKAKEFVKSNNAEEITHRFAELLIKFNEISIELVSVKKQLHETANKLHETINFINTIKPTNAATLQDIIDQTVENMKK
jgi:DNA anti-recombination protein RmuC